MRRRLILPILALIAVAVMLICIGIGTVPFNPGEVLRAIFVADDSPARLLIWNLRLPRILTGGMVGICLALSGCILQCVMRSNLASPSTIGVTSGAGFAGYLMLAAFPGSAHLLPIGAIVGAFAASMLIFALAYRRGAGSVMLILSGMAVSAIFGAWNDIIRTFFADRLGNVAGFLVGGLSGTGWDSLFRILPYAAVGMLVCILLPTGMNILMLGDETASSLGLRTGRFRFLLIAVSSLLAGAAISAAGLIGFVGLIVPHIARLMVGSDHRLLLPTSAFLGCILVTVCDTVGRVILPPGEIPVSILLAFIGAPFFLWLLHTRKKEGR